MALENQGLKAWILLNDLVGQIGRAGAADVKAAHSRINRVVGVQQRSQADGEALLTGIGFAQDWLQAIADNGGGGR